MTAKYSRNSGPPHCWTPGGPWQLLPMTGSAHPPTPPAPPRDSPMSPGTEPEPPAWPMGRHQPGSTARRPGCRRCTWCPAGASCRPTATYTWCRWSCAHPPGSPRTQRTGAWASLCREDRGWEAGGSPSGHQGDQTAAYVPVTSQHFFIWTNTKSKIDGTHHISPSCPFRIMMDYQLLSMRHVL